MQGACLVGHVAQAKAYRDAIKMAVRKRQAFGVTLHRRQEQAAIDQAIAADAQHACVDIGQPDFAICTHLTRQASGEIA